MHDESDTTDTSYADWVRASEIGEYAYCGRAYWLQHVVGEGEPEDAGHAEQLAAGATAHEDYGRQHLRHAVVRRRVLTAIGIMLLIVAVAVAILAGRAP